MRTWRQAQDEAERQHRFTEAASLGIGVHWYDEPDFRKSRYAADEWRCQSLFAASAAMTHMEQTRRFRSMTPEEWHAASRRGERMYAPLKAAAKSATSQGRFGQPRSVPERSSENRRGACCAVRTPTREATSNGQR